MTTAYINEARETRGDSPSHSAADVRYAPGLKMARAMGWFGIGLGLCQVLAPRAMARLTGVNCSQTMRLFGLREIVTGVCILRSQQPATGMWARVAGDAMDVATLGTAYVDAHTHGDDEARERRLLISLAAVAGATAVDVLGATQLTAARRLEG